jgi:hypothetical protein
MKRDAPAGRCRAAKAARLLCPGRRRRRTAGREPDNIGPPGRAEIERAEEWEDLLGKRAGREEKEGVAKQAHEQADLIAAERIERLVFVAVFFAVAVAALIVAVCATITMVIAPDLRPLAAAAFVLAGGLAALLRTILRARPVPRSGDDGQGGGGDA